MDKRANEIAAGAGTPGAGGSAGVPVTIDFAGGEPDVVYVEVERPVYVPQAGPAPQRPAASGREAVRSSNAEGIIPPSEYSGAAMIYDYSPDWVYEVYTQPLRITDIRLEPGERALEAPFISDSVRWVLGASVSIENGAAVQHIYVKPVQAAIDATLIINTDRRAYYIILRSYADVFMPMVRWRYPGLPSSYVMPSGGIGALPGTDPSAGPPAFDPRFISFNYRVRYPLFKKPTWLPELVYDDGRKTYVVFPRGVLQGSFPAVFDDRSNVVNYRVLDHVVVIDRLIEKITVSLGDRSITIEKKRGQ
jgi:type IV secretion system protein VirB9